MGAYDVVLDDGRRQLDVYLQVLGELAQHCGHADILREPRLVA